MTIIEAISNIYEFLVNNDIYSFEEFVKNKTLVFADEKEKQETKSIYLLAAEELVKNNVIKKIDNKDKWVLVRPVQMLEQNVVITGELASAISQTVNMVSQKLEGNHTCDPLNVNKEDIKYLLGIVITLLSGKDKE